MEDTKEAFLELGLKKYCEWLNTFTKDDPKPHTYKPEQFMVNDPEKNLYGTYNVDYFDQAFLGSAAWERRVLIASVYDGDDGGPTDLFMIFEKAEDTWECLYILQGFDTMFSEVYNEKGF